jgi:hypothetical protein
MENNFGEPNYFKDMVKDRGRIFLLLKRPFTGIHVSGGGYNLEKRRWWRLQPREVAVAAATT